MKIARSLLSTVIISLIVSYSGFCKADIDVTVYCDDNYPPYSYEENGEVKGIYVEVLKKAFSLMEGYNVGIRAIPWKRGLHNLKRGKAFALFPPYYHPKERPYMWPYSEPILDEEVVVICREEILKNFPRPDWPEDYYGLTIGNNAGFELGGDKCRQARENGKIKIDEVKGNRENILKLGLKRTDCYINDRLSVLWELKRLKEDGIYDEGGKHSKLAEGAVISSEQGYLGFTKMDKGRYHFKEDFVKKFNTIIRKMKDEGEIKKIVDKFTV